MIIAVQTLVFFRESLIAALKRFIGPYFMNLKLTFSRNGVNDEEEDEEVFAEFDEDKGVVFFPPVYLQRYAAVSDSLIDDRWCGKLQKVIDLGYHDMSFIKYLKDVPGIRTIMGVDLETIPLRCSSDLLGCDAYAPKREDPLQVILYEGNAADPDYRLIGCDAVIAIEMIEHMLPHDLDRLVHTIFGFVKPWVAIISTPNGDFNVLFKALEKNGLRRLDHFFEWSREQFNDWCSNIVERYPDYTVTCKGIGPGPPGTLHLGCCSQMAVFVAKDYHKKPDLSPNSLALVAKAPSTSNLTYIMGDQDSNTALKLSSAQTDQSQTGLLNSDPESYVTLVLSPTSSIFSEDTIQYEDKTSQCNLDTEASRNFLMFDDEHDHYKVLMPRRQARQNKVYEIGNVASRLNCSTFQVKKFSKTSQNLMAKNKIDALGYTREIVDEIRHLTKMLNFNKNNYTNTNGTHIWNNINWGENAPYWNQYYTVVREHKYPLENKSEEDKMLDLISEEINRLVDLNYNVEHSVDVYKFEIPIDHLMKVVRHYTTDLTRVKDLLEWNGYEVTDNAVVHSRRIADDASTTRDNRDYDWPDDNLSDDVKKYL